MAYTAMNLLDDLHFALADMGITIYDWAVMRAIACRENEKIHKLIETGKLEDLPVVYHEKVIKGKTYSIATMDAYEVVYGPIRPLFAYMSVSEICERWDISPRTVNASLKKLELLGFIIVVRRKKGRTCYRRINVEKLREWARKSQAIKERKAKARKVPTFMAERAPDDVDDSDSVYDDEEPTYLNMNFDDEP